jgi:hypothetical protein
MCVIVRDLIVFGVLTDLMKGRPAVYATFSSYDEVAHHSGLERADTLEALRKLDQQFGRIDRARRYSSRPYEIVVLSDHGQTQGATFKQRRCGLDDLSSARSNRKVAGSRGDENSMVDHAMNKQPGAAERNGRRTTSRSTRRGAGSATSGIYLMEERRRMTLEEIEERHPALIPALREHPHVGWSSYGPRTGRGARAERNALSVRRARRKRGSLAPFSPTAHLHLGRTDRFAHVADIMVGSFYDPELDEGCAFEELISFHGGLGGLQTRPFILYPIQFAPPDEKIIGAAHVHQLLQGWRRSLESGAPQTDVAA